MSKKCKSFLILFVIIAVLSACATGEKTEQSEGGKGDPKRVVIAQDENITTIDPHNGSTTTAQGIQDAMYERLYEIGEDYEMHPGLATDYELSDDGLEYTFELREGVQFTDGAEFNAEAVKINFDRILDSKGSLSAYRGIETVEKVEVLDNDKIKLTLSNPNNQFLFQLNQVRIASPKALNDGVDLNEVSAGTGPFELEEWNHGDSLVLKKNEGYWDSEYPKVDQIVYKPVPEDGSRVAMLKAGDADLAYPLPEKDIDSLKKKDGIVVEVDEATRVRYTTLNTTKKYLDDKKIRQAMNYAIDKEQFAKVVKNGFAEPLDSILPHANVFHSSQHPYEYDLDKAKELMKEAGVEDGFTVEIWGDDSSENNRSMQFIQQQLKEINIDVEIQQFERGTLDDKIYSPEGPEEAEVEMWYVSWSTETGDTDNGIRPLFSTDAFPPNGANTAYYSNEKVDKLINDALAETDDKKAAQKYDELQSIVYDEAPWLFLGVDKLVYAKNEKLDGIWITPMGEIHMKKTELK